MVFVVLKHADTVFNDEEEVDAGQRREPLPHSIKLFYQIDVIACRRFAVVVVSLRLQTGSEEGGSHIHQNMDFIS